MPDNLNYQPLFSEILEKVAKLKTKKEKVAFLQRYNTDALRMVIKSSFDPKIEWDLPEGSVPFMPNEAPEGTEHTMLITEARKLFHFIKGGNPKITRKTIRTAVKILFISKESMIFYYYGRITC